MLLAAAMPDRVSPERTVELAPLPGLLPVSPPSPGSEGLSGTVEPPSSMLPSTRPRTASEASPAVTRPSPLLSRPLFHWYSMLPLDHRVELGSDFEIGRASCRERVVKYGLISVVAGIL